MRKYITDDSGLRYYLELVEDSGDSFHVEIRRKGDWVGYANYQRYPMNTEITEVEIYIRDDSDPPRRNSLFSDFTNLPTWIKKSATITELKKDSKDYRHRGLGTKLLNLLIEHAKERKVHRLYGSVMQDDIEKTPRLVEWYERHGFQRCSQYQGCIANTAVWIFMDLT